MAKSGFKPGDQVIMTKIEKVGNYEYSRIGDIYIIKHVVDYGARSAYWTTFGSYIGISEECELTQSYLNEQKIKKLLGVE